MSRLGRIIGFLVLVLTVAGLIHYYVWLGLAARPAWPAPWPMLIGVALVVGLALVPLGLGGWRVLGRERARVASWVGLVWCGAVTYLFIALLPFELVRAFAPATAALTIARVAALTALGVALVVTVVGVRTALRGAHDVAVDIPIAGLPAALAGLRIVQISDLHVGPTIGHAEVEALVRRIRALDPDLVAITGDLVDGSVAELSAHVAPLADLDAPLGTWFVTGNHEYYSGHEAWLAHLPTLGIKVLRNARARLDHKGGALDVVGIPDVQGAAFGDPPDLDRALHGRADDGTTMIVLAHRPSMAHAAAARGAALVLSGHTHAGQMAPFGWLAKIGQPAIRGLVRLDRTWLYTSEGTGYWGPPMRVRTRSELTLLVLTAA